MDVQMKRGILDGLVLSILKRGDTYGYELTEQVSRTIDISEMTLYPVLRRLEAQGFLGNYSMEINGRLRRYYTITPSGLTKLDDITLELKALRQLIDHMIGEEET